MLSAIAIGPNRGWNSAINEVCAEHGGVCVYKTVPFYPRQFDLTQLLNIITPDLVFLDLDASESSFEMGAQIKDARRDAAVVGLVRRDDHEMKLQASRVGIQHLLVLPVSREEFRRLVDAVTSGQTGAGLPDNLLAVAPAKGGSGATTTAVHLAAALAADGRLKVLLLEADQASGSLGALLGIGSEHSILAAVERARNMDDRWWVTLPARVLGFDALVMPEQRPSASRLNYHRLLSFTRSRYDVVIADLPEILDEGSETIARLARWTFLVSTPERQALHLAKRRAEELRARGVPEEKIRHVLTRQLESVVSLEEVEERLGRSVTFVLPSDDWRARHPEAVLVDPHSKLGLAYQSLAQLLSGREVSKTA